MHRALCELGEAKHPLDNYSPVCQFFGIEVSSCNVQAFISQRLILGWFPVVRMDT